MDTQTATNSHESVAAKADSTSTIEPPNAETTAGSTSLKNSQDGNSMGSLGLANHTTTSTAGDSKESSPPESRPSGLNASQDGGAFVAPATAPQSTASPEPPTVITPQLAPPPTGPFSQLPVELILAIFSRLSTEELLTQVGLVSKRFRELALHQLTNELQLSHLWATLDDSKLVRVLACFPPGSLRNVSLAWCNRVTDGCIKRLVEHSPGIVSLDLFYNFLITDKAIGFIASNCPKLRYLNLRRCSALTDKIVPFLLKLESLTTLNIAQCPKITEKAKAKLQEKIPNVIV